MRKLIFFSLTFSFREDDKIYMIMELGDTDLREYSKKVLNVLEDGNEEKNDKIEHILRNILKAFVELHNKGNQREFF